MSEEKAAVRYLYGDANLDSAVNISDVTFIQKALAGLEEIANDEAMINADVIEPYGIINSNDVSAIQKYLAHLPDIGLTGQFWIKF